LVFFVDNYHFAIIKINFINSNFVLFSMKKIKTGDGSYTFVDDEYGEVLHSITGAEEEAIKKYAEPTNIAELAKKGEINILDVCFGVGYNSAAAIDAALKTNSKCKINIVGLEVNDKLLGLVDELTPKFKSYGFIREIKNNSYKDNNITIQLIFGDAKKTIKKVKGEFDVCFLDPFSPKTQPEMWTEEFFKDIAAKLKTGAVLATYSCATPVRINLVRAGFDVRDGPSVGRAAPSTLATKVL